MEMRSAPQKADGATIRPDPIVKQLRLSSGGEQGNAVVVFRHSFHPWFGSATTEGRVKPHATAPALCKSILGFAIVLGGCLPRHHRFSAGVKIELAQLLQDTGRRKPCAGLGVMRLMAG